MAHNQYLGKKFTLWLVDENEEHMIQSGWIAASEKERLVLVRDGGQLDI
jgi:hypothetical protein